MQNGPHVRIRTLPPAAPALIALEADGLKPRSHAINDEISHAEALNRSIEIAG